MKTNAKKIIAVILLALLIVISVSCSAGDDNKNGGDADNSGNANQDKDENQDEAKQTTERIYPDLKEQDFGGYEFRILARTTSHIDWAKWKHRDIYAEEENGDPINDAVYKRNRYVENEYNCVISQILAEDHQNKLTKAVRAGDNEYDLYYSTLGDLSSSVTTGNYMNLNDFPVINLGGPWWDANARDSLSINKKLYFCPSDLILLHKSAASAVIFNKELIKEYEMEDLYSLVLSGKWIVDKFIAMTKDIYRDVNGDGIMDENDLYGLACYRDALSGIMHGCGGRVCEKDGEDLPYLTLNSETAMAAINKAFDLMYAPSAWNLHKELEPRGLPVYETTERMFMENRVLFYSILMCDVEQFRSMDSDFGIIPIPKLNETQKAYGSSVNHHVGRAVAIPVTVIDKECVGTILEALTAESKYTLVPAYYEITLQRKVSRDDESEAMLDIIFNSHIYDPGLIYNFGNYAMDIIMMTMKNDRNITSLYEKSEAKANNDIEKFITNLQKLEN
ncbi:MAG: hypothetical protein FWD23_14330 [Oscillospiraceae bacterium]|nr:hypothetical protein [Oscillospiraceae bacterium]